jgi:type IV secretory pathway VirB10-like protein
LKNILQCLSFAGVDNSNQLLYHLCLFEEHMKNSIVAAAISLSLIAVACGQKEEVQQAPAETPAAAPATPPPAPPAPVVDSAAIKDSIAKAEAAAAAAKKPAAKKPAKAKETVQKSEDGSASGGQIRASRDEKKEGEASGGTIRKSR